MQVDEYIDKKLTTHRKTSKLNIDKAIMEQNYHNKNFNALIQDWYKMANYLIWKCNVPSYYRDDDLQTAVIHMYEKIHLYNPMYGSKLFSYSYRVIFLKIVDCTRKRDIRVQVLKKSGVEIIPLEEDMEIPTGTTITYFENSIKYSEPESIPMFDKQYSKLLLDTRDIKSTSIEWTNKLKTFKFSIPCYKSKHIIIVATFIAEFKKVIKCYDELLNEKELARAYLLDKRSKDEYLKTYTVFINAYKIDLNNWINKANCLMQE